MPMTTLPESEAGEASLTEDGRPVRIAASISLNGGQPAKLGAVLVRSVEDAGRKVSELLHTAAAATPERMLGPSEPVGLVGALLAVNGREPNEVASVEVAGRDDAAEAVPAMLRDLADHLEEHGPFYALIGREFF